MSDLPQAARNPEDEAIARAVHAGAEVIRRLNLPPEVIEAAGVIAGAVVTEARPHLVAAEHAPLPPRGPDGFRDVTCGNCGETFGTNCDDTDIACVECEARRCPDCGSWFGAEND